MYNTCTCRAIYAWMQALYHVLNSDQISSWIKWLAAERSIESKNQYQCEFFGGNEDQIYLIFISYKHFHITLQSYQVKRSRKTLVWLSYFHHASRTMWRKSREQQQKLYTALLQLHQGRCWCRRSNVQKKFHTMRSSSLTNCALP